MRTLKIIVITVILLVLAGLALMGIRSLLPSAFGPNPEEFSEEYHDHPDELDTDDIYSATPKQYEGIVKPLGVSIYMEGSHRLEKDDELVVLLESEEVNLPDFEGKEVKVTGTVRDTVEGGQKIMTVRFLEQLEESGVKAFNEVGYEFSFSYPADWQSKKEKNKVTFYREVDGEEENLIIVYQYPDIEESFDEWVQNKDQNLFFEESQVQVGGVTGIRRTIQNVDQEVIKTYAKGGNNAYEIRLVSQEEPIRNQYFSIVDFFQTSFQAGANIESNSDSDNQDPEQDVEQDPEEGDDEDTATTEDEQIEEEQQEPQEDEDEQDSEAVSGDETETTTSSGPTFSTLEPLEESAIQRVVDKGFSPFEGRTLAFSFPSVWYFAYLGDGTYGFTDDTTYQENNEEIEISSSRMLLVVGNNNVSCAAEVTKTIEDTTYTVCTGESGLEEVAQKVADSLKLPTE